MTRISAVRIIHVCGFCPPEKRIEAADVCTRCGEDICPRHSFGVGVPRMKEIQLLRSLAKVNVPDNWSLKLSVICPTCANEPVFKVVDAISHQ